MEPDLLPREILYGELREGVRRVDRPLLRYKEVIKRDLRSALIDTSAWEDIAKHQDIWRQSVKTGVSKAEANASVQATCKRAARKEGTASACDSTRHVCATCNSTETATPGSGYRLFETRMPLIISLRHLLFGVNVMLNLSIIEQTHGWLSTYLPTCLSACPSIFPLNCLHKKGSWI